MRQLLFTKYANRFSPWKKKAFRTALITELEQLGYTVVIDKKLLSTNLYFGNIDSDYILTAHYDTATNMAVLYPFMKYFGARYGQIVALLPILLVAIFLPQFYFGFVMSYGLILLIGLLVPNRYNFNDNSSGVLTVLEHAIENKDNPNFFYALTDNEEKGLFGAKALRTYLKKNNRLGIIKNINIDCVGVGNKFAITSINDNAYLQECVDRCSNLVPIQKISSKLLASDHIAFGKNGIMITKLSDSKYLGDVYIPNLHTNRDRYLDQDNIDITLQIIKKITEEIT